LINRAHSVVVVGDGFKRSYAGRQFV